MTNFGDLDAMDDDDWDKVRPLSLPFGCIHGWADNNNSAGQ